MTTTAEPLAGDQSVEDIQEQVLHKEWTFTDGQKTESFVQKPMSWMGKIEFMGLLGRTIEQTMAGPDGLTIEGILGAGNPLEQEFRLTSATDQFVSGLARLASFAPDLFDHCYCIWLRIPLKDRDWARELWNLPEDEGGMDDQTGEDILTTFIEQNFEALEDFFSRRLRRIGQKVTDLRSARAASPPSKPSRRTRRTTQKG